MGYYGDGQYWKASRLKGGEIGDLRKQFNALILARSNLAVLPLNHAIKTGAAEQRVGRRACGPSDLPNWWEAAAISMWQENRQAAGRYGPRP
jgi:hypothetical protein